MSESTTKTARLFLGVNGLFSCLVGLVLLLLNQAVAVVLFHEPATWGALTLRVLGVGLLVFSVYLAVLVVNRFVSKGAVMMIVYADMGWLIASAFVVLIDDRVLTDQGILIIDLTAIVVAICAIGQYVGARRIIPSKSRARVYLNHGVLVASVSREVAAPSHVVWAVMTDHPAYADVANNLSKVDIVSGEGLGMVRRCFGLKGENWTETCSGYEDENYFSFWVHTEAHDYPYPFQELQGRWSVKNLGDRAKFSIDITAKPKGHWLARSAVILGAKLQFKNVLIDLADAWAYRMEKSAI